MLGLLSPAWGCVPVRRVPRPQLQPRKSEDYTAPDKSASAGLPSGWKVTTGAKTVIVMTGPQGETISLGNTLIVRNATFQLNQPVSGGVDLSIPNSDTLSQKFTMAMQHGAAIAGFPDPQVKITSETPSQVPSHRRPVRPHCRRHEWQDRPRHRRRLSCAPCRSMPAAPTK